MTDILPPMPWVYYEYALKKFDSEKYEFFCFSDDIDDVKKNFDVKKFNFLENNNELEDLYCLSQCDSIIMSNSTFSWWGAWLGKKKGKSHCTTILVWKSWSTRSRRFDSR